MLDVLQCSTIGAIIRTSSSLAEKLNEPEHRVHDIILRRMIPFLQNYRGRGSTYVSCAVAGAGKAGITWIMQDLE